MNSIDISPFNMLHPASDDPEGGGEGVPDLPAGEGPAAGGYTAEVLEELEYRKKQVDELRSHLTLMSDWEMGFVMNLIEMRDEVSASGIEGERLLSLSSTQIADIQAMTVTYAVVTDWSATCIDDPGLRPAD